MKLSEGEKFVKMILRIKRRAISFLLFYPKAEYSTYPLGYGSLAILRMVINIENKLGYKD